MATSISSISFVKGFFFLLIIKKEDKLPFQNPPNITIFREENSHSILKERRYMLQQKKQNFQVLIIAKQAKEILTPFKIN